MRIKRRGYLLVMVIGIGALMFLSGIAAVSIGSQDALQQRQLEKLLQARCAADVGVAEAMNKLSVEPGFDGSLDKIVGGGGEYNLDLGAATGLNNLEGQKATQVDGRVIPAGTACLRSEGSQDGMGAESCAIVSMGGVLFDDDFSRPAPGWESNHPNLTVYLLGKWVLDLKLLTQTYLAKGDESWRNYTMEATVLLSQGSNMGFVVRASGAPNKMSGYVVGYSLLEDLLHGGTFYLNRMENGKMVERVQQRPASSSGLLGGLGWLLNIYHTYRITVKNNTIVATVDGKEIINAEMTKPIKAGKVGILPGLASLMLLDRVTVRSIPEVRARWRSL